MEKKASVNQSDVIQITPFSSCRECECWFDLGSLSKQGIIPTLFPTL